MNRNAMPIDSFCPKGERIAPVAARERLALAMAYVPMQCLSDACSPENALLQGTLFPDLDKPFLGVKGRRSCGQ